jgi:hypothetical protein
MPIFTAIAAGATALATAVGFGAAAAASIGAFVVRTMVTIGISKLVANRANKTGAGAQDVGARVQLGPATNNKLSVSYGSAFLAPTVTDAKITTDQKTMYYVFSLCEASSGTMSFGKIFWNGKEVTLGAGDYSGVNKVVSLTTNATTPQVDTTIDGYAWIYQFSNGSSSGVNTGGTSAITILSDASIPLSDRWTATDLMSDTCFIVVKVVYNKDVQDAQQMPRLSVQLTNTLTKPGAVLLDYMTDTQYGCAIDVANIDTASLTALDVYSDQTITYVPVGGGTTTQPRYRIDGPVNTGDNCLSNLQQLVDACDSWLQYSELTGQWTIVMNKPYTGTLSSLYSVDSSVLIGGIDINPIDLNQTYNSLEVQYPNANINDQTDYKVVDLTTVGTAWYDPSLLSPNEPDNRLVVQYPQINNYIRAVYLGVRRLLQSREDLTIVCNLDYSGIQVVAGDVVRVTLAEYGWTDKLFRVSQVQETKTSDGFLGARITAFEYNGTIYADNALEDFIPEANTGLTDPNIIGIPGTPIATINTLAESGAVTSFSVASTVPTSGSVLYMDFNYGATSNTASHLLYKTVQSANGSPFTSGTSVSIEVNDAPIGNYYLSTTARNDFAGRTSASSSVFNWNANLQANSVTFTNISAIGFGELMTDNYDLGTNDPFTGFIDITDPVNFGDYYEPAVIPAAFSGGGNISANVYMPYVQGTATTADGFLTNSTGPFAPNLGAGILVGPNGSQAWWVSAFLVPTLQVLSVDSSVTVSCNWILQTTGSNTHIQFCPWAIFTGSTPAGEIELQTYQSQDFILNPSGGPSIFESVSRDDFLSGTANITAFGYAIRCLSSTDDVFIMSQNVVARQVKV